VAGVDVAVPTNATDARTATAGPLYLIFGDAVPASGSQVRVTTRAGGQTVVRTLLVYDP
jgi:hypothetical protein